MRQRLTTYQNNVFIDNPQDSGRSLFRMKLVNYLLGMILATLVSDIACAHAVAGIEPTSGFDASLSRIKSLAAGLYAPTQKPNHQDQQKILLAHAIIVKTSPAQGGVAPGNIGKVDVWYDAGIRDSLAALAVVSAAGERIDKHDAAIDSADPAHVSVSVNPMAPGKYTVRYRALSADGHMVSGAWEFDVQP